MTAAEVRAGQQDESGQQNGTEEQAGTQERDGTGQRDGRDRPTLGPAAAETPGSLADGLRLLGRGIRREPRIFLAALVGSVLYGGMTVASALVVGRVTQRVILPDIAAGSTSRATLTASFLAIFGVAVLKAAGIVARRLFAGVLQYRLQAGYRREVTRRYLQLPMAWHQRHPTGQLLSNANADVESMWFPVAPMPFALGVIIMIAITLVALFLTDPVLACIGAALFPAVFGLNLVYERKLSPIYTRAQQLRADVSGLAHESFDGALVVKTLGREAQETERFRKQAELLRDSLIQAGRVRGLFDPALEALPNLAILAVLLVGTVRVQSGAISTGDLVQVAYLLTLLAFPVRAIGWVLGELPRAVVGWRRVSAVLSAEGELRYGTEAPTGDGPAQVDLEKVGFSYAADLAPALRGVRLEVAAGQTIALVGPTGSGKSTLTQLLLRLVDPETGVVTLDGTDLRSFAPGALAQAATLVPQNTFLFDDTLRGNVTLDDAFTDEEVWTALRLAQAARFVAALPAGLDTVVGERGTTLSGGQRQRVALARALVRRPRLLVLDDATSSVDPQVEAAILTGLRGANLPSTVVVVAYRQATIDLADEVVWMEGGRVLARGSSAELIATVPGYRRLVTAYADAQEERDRERAVAGQVRV